MSRRDDLLLGGVLLAGLLAVTQRRAIYDTFARGAQLTSTKLGPDGVIRLRPAELAAAAAVELGHEVDRGTHALARVGRSERDRNERDEVTALRMHVMINDLAELSWARDLEDLATYSTNAQARGFFGEQFTPATRAPGGVKSVRRYASSRDPYVGDYHLAAAVRANAAAGIDPTGGAVKFVDVDAFGAQEGTGSYAQVAADWAREGLRPFNVDGAPDNFVVFRRV
jgi:hypothetical protein